MKLNLKAIARSMGMALQKHSPEILTGIGIAGMVTTTILAVRATPKALLLMETTEEIVNASSGKGFKVAAGISKLTRFLEKAKEAVRLGDLDKYGREGVAALASATPVDSGLTARSWHYKIENRKGSVAISFYNSNVQNGVPIAVILQYGHGTGTGGWVAGRDYINPAIQPVFDKIANEAWREVTAQ